MNALRLIIYTFLCVGISLKIEVVIAQMEDLVDEYYTTICKPTNGTFPQDDKDAQDIIDSNMKEEVIAGILSYRSKTRRFAIQQRMLTKLGHRISHSSKSSSYASQFWVSQLYRPQRHGNSTHIFLDLCFGLLEDENVVLSQYLRNFFQAKDESWITIGMVLTKDMGAMISAYDKNVRPISFTDTCKDQRHPFEEMLSVWVRHNRDLIETGEPNKDDVMRYANALKYEHDKKKWNQNEHDVLRLILMYKSIKYARAVIAEFETIMGNKHIESIINYYAHNNTKLDPGFANAYSSLARYIKNKYSYIADILGKYSDGKDYWAAWIMSIAVLHPQEWPKVDSAFQKHNGYSLSKFIVRKLTANKVMAEMIAAIVDSNFEPVQFSKKPVQGGRLESPVLPITPSVPSTAIAPKLYGHSAASDSSAIHPHYLIVPVLILYIFSINLLP